MAAANSIECIREMIGDTLRGVLTSKRPKGGAGAGSMTTYTLVFESGRGLTFAANGDGGYMVYWQERPDDLRRDLDRKAEELRATGVALSEVLALAGAHQHKWGQLTEYTAGYARECRCGEMWWDGRPEPPSRGQSNA